MGVPSGGQEGSGQQPGPSQPTQSPTPPATPQQAQPPQADAPVPAGRVIDLDESRAARAETVGAPVQLRFKGETYELPPELPVEFADRLRNVQIREAFEVVLGPVQAEKFFAASPSVKDFESFTEQLGKVYGVGEGKMPASLRSLGF